MTKIALCWRRLFNLGKDRSGLSAVEFGLISPMIGFVFLALADVGNAVVQIDNMQRALDAGSQYFMNGGTNATVGKSVVTGAWTNEPTGGAVNIVPTCTTSCTSSGWGTGSATVAISATATIKGFMLTLPISQSQNVRVQ